MYTHSLREKKFCKRFMNVSLNGVVEPQVPFLKISSMEITNTCTKKQTQM